MNPPFLPIPHTQKTMVKSMTPPAHRKNQPAHLRALLTNPKPEGERNTKRQQASHVQTCDKAKRSVGKGGRGTTTHTLLADFFKQQVRQRIRNMVRWVHGGGGTFFDFFRFHVSYACMSERERDRKGTRPSWGAIQTDDQADEARGFE